MLGMLRKITIIALMLLVAFGANAQRKGARTKVIAHRGYWKAEGAAQNSIRSLIKADSVHCWGSEFDVWMSKDGTLYVNHDADINGVVIQNSKSRDIAKQKLSNGEFIPTLEQLLQTAVNLPKLQLVCELKPHDNKKQEAKAVKKIIKMVKKYGLQDRMTYITFSLPGMKELIKRAPQGTEVYYLNGELTPQELKDMGAAGMDYHFDVFLSNKNWTSQCHQLGLKSNAWTVDVTLNSGLVDHILDMDLDFITTNTPEEMKHVIHERGIFVDLPPRP